MFRVCVALQILIYIFLFIAQAQIMNLVSRSHGKEPNRQLHLVKKPKQLASQSFQVQICNEVYDELQTFDKKYSKLSV